LQKKIASCRTDIYNVSSKPVPENLFKINKVKIYVNSTFSLPNS
jgi:hypothetical protein